MILKIFFTEFREAQNFYLFIIIKKNYRHMILSQRNQTSTQKFQLKDEPHIFLKIEKDTGVVDVLYKDFEPMPNYSYRMVRYSQSDIQQHQAENLYSDPKYQINIAVEFPGEQVLIKRLSNLYGLSNLPNFFDLNKEPTHVQFCHMHPHCIEQLGIFDTLYYKKMFITQSWSESGKYILTANIDGRFQIISVDDKIPVYKKTLEPVWGLRFENPWEIILIKAWAKINGGYHKLSQLSEPFHFIESFSNGTWKYYNIQKQAQKFLKYYSVNSKFRNGKIVLKTKHQLANSNYLSINGFAPNSACYELIGLFKQEDLATKKPKFILAIRGTDQAKWVGQISFYKKNSQKYFLQGMNLQHDFFMTQTQFLSVFSSAFIASSRAEDYYIGYKVLQIPANYKKAFHFEFFMPTDGFLDFNIKQFQQNRIQAGEESKIQQSNIQIFGNIKENSRFLKTRYILVKDNGSEHQAAQSHYRSSIVGSNAKDYHLPRFTTYEIQYLKGYNKGDTHFVKLQKGRYILRFKSQTIYLEAKYVFNWVCNHRIVFENASLSQGQKTQLLHDSMVSIMHKFPHFNFNKEQKTQMITIINPFQEIGYGFVAIQCSHQCKRSIVLEVDPNILRKEGYIFKGRYKHLNNSNQIFRIKIQKGEYASIVFKKSKQNLKHQWPSKAFSLYKKQLKKGALQSNEQFVKASAVAQSKIPKNN